MNDHPYNQYHRDRKETIMIKANDDEASRFKTGNSPPIDIDDRPYFGIQSFANGQHQDSVDKNENYFDTYKP
jgi:hypothetical protein